MIEVAVTLVCDLCGIEYRCRLPLRAVADSSSEFLLRPANRPSPGAWQMDTHGLTYCSDVCAEAPP